MNTGLIVGFALTGAGLPFYTLGTIYARKYRHRFALQLNTVPGYNYKGTTTTSFNLGVSLSLNN